MNDTNEPARAEEELIELVGRLGSPLVDMTALTLLPGPDRTRGCYRLRLRDGRVFKYRHMRTATRAELVQQLTNLIDSPHVPRVLDRCGRGLLIEYVEGRPLQRDRLSPALLAEAASLHGRLHEVDVSEMLPQVPSLSAEKRAASLRSSLARLVSHGALGSRESAELWDVAVSHAPRTIDRCLTHNDYCPRNIVLTDEGRLVIVDNETVNIGPRPFDLARTWYLWPMTAAERAVYWKSYSRHRDLDDFASSFFFWVIDAMVRSALFRLMGQSPEADVPLENLRLILRDFDPHNPRPQPHYA